MQMQVNSVNKMPFSNVLMTQEVVKKPIRTTKMLIL